jgi:hypothetical protein
MKVNLISVCFLCGLIAFSVHSEAAYISEIEANNSLSSAQNLDAGFTLGSDPNILKSDTIPWVSVSATGDGSFDYFSFTVSSAGARGIIDIDFGIRSGGSIDTEMFLFNAAGSKLAASNDAYPSTRGAGGSVTQQDPFLDYIFGSSGSYIIAVGEYNCSADGRGRLKGNVPDSGDTYTLQVSIEGHPVAGAGATSHSPIPSAALLFGSGLVGLVVLSRRFSRAT